MIIPAIDLMGGKCVRLFKGDFNRRTDYNVTPLQVAKHCRAAGADYIHVVDLDGARHQTSKQSELIVKLAHEGGVKIQTGGGLRDLAVIQTLLNEGVSRVVIGSLAVTDPHMVKFWLGEIGSDKIVIALDVVMGEDGLPFPTRHGWTEKGKINLWDLLDDYVKSGLSTILVTDIERDGVLEGTNVELYRDIRTKYPDLKLITSGGVGSLDDVRELKALQPEGIVVGKALYEDRFTLTEALAC